MCIRDRELDDLFYEEEFLRKEGKTGLTVDYLYNAIEKIGFINELHGDAIECAWQNNDIEFLRTQWEDLALDQIRALQAIINGMLRVTLLNQVTRYRVEKPRDFDPFGHAGFAHLWLQYD